MEEIKENSLVPRFLSSFLSFSVQEAQQRPGNEAKTCMYCMKRNKSLTTLQKGYMCACVFVSVGS